MTYFPSDFLGLWQAMQLRARIGATSLRKPTGAGSSALARVATATEASTRAVANGERDRVIAATLREGGTGAGATASRGRHDLHRQRGGGRRVVFLGDL